MKLLSIYNSFHTSDYKVKSIKKKSVSESVGSKSIERKDIWEPSEFVDDSKREEFLELIKKRVKSGYYNSNSVTEDLSNGFASYFNNIL